jgi:hypothetical protein
LRGIDGQEYGPYTFEQIKLFVGEQRIIAASQLSHPKTTGGKWVNAASIPMVAILIGSIPKVTNEKIPPLQQSTQETGATSPRSNDQPSELAVNIANLFRNDGNGSLHRRTGFWQFVKDFIDPTFQHYVTPTVVMITWWIVLITTAMGLILFFIALTATVVPISEAELANQPVRPRPQFAPPALRLPDSVGRLMSASLLTVIQIVATILFLLWVRVILELFIVVFHISDSLKKIEQKSKFS